MQFMSNKILNHKFQKKIKISNKIILVLHKLKRNNKIKMIIKMKMTINKNKNHRNILIIEREKDINSYMDNHVDK